jgi:xanthine dehydrogenase accessory factor
MKLALLDELRRARHDQRAVAWLSWLDGRDQQLVTAASAPAALGDVVATALRMDQATVVETADGAVLVEPHNPPVRLIVIGAVHIAEPLAKMAALAGFAVTIIDPRRAWATAARFPDQTLVTEWPDAALQQLAPDARTAIVTLTHDPKLDDPALVVALRSPAFYIGCLGSKKTHAARRERLAAAGCSDLDRLHGPVGLALGARSPGEIAVSILGQIIATLRGAS